MENISLEVSVYKLKDKILIEFILVFYIYISNAALRAVTLLEEV
jgi:hypothetical protein